MQGRHQRIRAAITTRADAGGLALVPARPASNRVNPAGRVEYSVGEDSRILDIANNPAHASRVPLSVWQDAVNTGDFGNKTVCQVQGRHQRIRAAITKRSDAGGLALVPACPTSKRRADTGDLALLHRPRPSKRCEEE